MSQIKQVLVLRDFGARLYTTAMQQFGQVYLTVFARKSEKMSKLNCQFDCKKKVFNKRVGHSGRFLLACAHF